MQHTDKHGKLIKVGQRVLIPGKIVGLRDATGRFNTTVQLSNRYENTPEEIILNHTQVELHPDETPAEPATEVPAAGGVKDSNVGSIQTAPKRAAAVPPKPQPGFVVKDGVVLKA